MPKVMMRCPAKAQGQHEFYTGLDISRKQGLRSLGAEMVRCKICDEHHFLRKAYFEGDDPGNQYTEHLDGAPAFALEIGIIIGGMSFLDSYILQIYCKLSGMSSSHGVSIFGAMTNLNQKIIVLEVLRDLLKLDPKRKEDAKDLAVLIKKIRSCTTIRDRYAHAKYHCSGYPQSIQMLPYYGDSRKRLDAISLSLEMVRDDAELLLATKFMIREYLQNGTRPV